MNKIRNAFRKLKARHWDSKFFCRDYGEFSHAGFEDPPLREVWRKYRAPIVRFCPWLAGVVVAALITKMLGL